MPEKAQYATAHRIRFREIRTPEMLQLAESPAGALSWKIGPSGEVGPDGYRLPADVWCAVGLYREFDAAKTALEARQQNHALSRRLDRLVACLAPADHAPG